MKGGQQVALAIGVIFAGLVIAFLAAIVYGAGEIQKPEYKAKQADEFAPIAAWCETQIAARRMPADVGPRTCRAAYEKAQNAAWERRQ